MKNGRYIFVLGAPGSKWSSVARNIYYSPTIDRSDSVPVPDSNPMHVGSYFDPGMGFGEEFNTPHILDKFSFQMELNRPFNGDGKRIIKSHVLCKNIDYIKFHFPDCPIVLVYRNDDSCLGWWVKAGGFDIPYPDYNPFYKNYKKMAEEIHEQNDGIRRALNMAQRGYYIPSNNKQLADMVHIEQPPEEFHQNYARDDIKVYVL